MNLTPEFFFNDVDAFPNVTIFFASFLSIFRLVSCPTNLSSSIAMFKLNQLCAKLRWKQIGGGGVPVVDVVMVVVC